MQEGWPFPVNDSTKDSKLTILPGGTLGFFCNHQYAHTSRSGRKAIPMAFKGFDLAIYSAFKALGLNVGVHPVIRNRSSSLGGLSVAELMDGPPYDENGVDHVTTCLASLGDSQESEDEFSFRESNPEEDDETTTVGTKLHGPTFDENYEEESEEVSVGSRPLLVLRIDESMFFQASQL